MDNRVSHLAPLRELATRLVRRGGKVSATPPAAPAQAEPVSVTEMMGALEAAVERAIPPSWMAGSATVDTARQRIALADSALSVASSHLSLPPEASSRIDELRAIHEENRKLLDVAARLVDQRGSADCHSLYPVLRQRMRDPRFEEYIELLFELAAIRPDIPVFALSRSGEKALDLPRTPLFFGHQLVRALPVAILDDPDRIAFLKQTLREGTVYSYQNIGAVRVPDREAPRHARIYGLISRLLGSHVPLTVFRDGLFVESSPESFLKWLLVGEKFDPQHPPDPEAYHEAIRELTALRSALEAG